MIKLSLCMIVKNEEEVLARCLNSIVEAVDEIIIVDTGSTDSTKEIARRYTNNVLDFKWVDDFALARNYSFSLATKDYCLWLDADDIVSKDNLQKLLELKKSLDADVDVIYLKYNVAFDNLGRTIFSYYRERIVKNCKEARWVEPVHEVIAPFGKVFYSNIEVEHHKINAYSTNRNLDIIEKTIKTTGEISPRLRYYYARELMAHKQYVKAIDNYYKLLDNPNAFVENKISACMDIYICEKEIYGIGNVSTLHKTFEYCVPRAEVLCQIGYHNLILENYSMAEYWYLAALQISPKNKSLGFLELDCYNYIPLIQLCVICDKTNRKEEAYKYNEEAGKIKPDSQAYQNNKLYFENLETKKG